MEKIKLLLGEKKFSGNQNIDNYIDIDLQRTIDTIKQDSTNNVFDFYDQYNTERNDSLKFCVYGMVQSRFGDCDNIAMSVSIHDSVNSGYTSDILYSPEMNSLNGFSISGVSFVILTKKLDSNDHFTKNIYGGKKASYYFLFEIDRNILKLNSSSNVPMSKSIFIDIFDKSKKLFSNIQIPFLYFDNSGTQVPFGTETSDIDDNNNIVSVSNNFPFFYDRHWIRSNIVLDGVTSVFFSTNPNPDTVSEKSGIFNLSVSLNKPSPYGLEKAEIVINNSIGDNGLPLTTSVYGTNYIFNPKFVSWSAGQLTNTVQVQVVDNLIVEPDNQITFSVNPIDFVKLSTNHNTSFQLNILNDDVAAKADFTKSSDTVIEPFATASSLSYTVNVIFDKGVTIPNQQLGVGIDFSKTTMLATDYTVNPPSNSTANASGFTTTTTVGQNGFSFSVSIKGNRIYDVDRFIVFNLINISGTSNLIVNNITPQFTLTVKDRINTYYTRYVIPVNPLRNVGILKPIAQGSDWNFFNPFVVTLKKGVFTGTTQNMPLLESVTSFRLSIINNGERIIHNGNVINNNNHYDIDFTNQTSDVILDLPANKGFVDKVYGYTGTQYSFTFSNIPINTAITNSALWKQSNDFETAAAGNVINKPYVDSNIYSHTYSQTLQNVYSASTLGNTSVYLVTKTKNVYSTFDWNNYRRNLMISAGTSSSTSSGNFFTNTFNQIGSIISQILGGGNKTITTATTFVNCAIDATHFSAEQFTVTNDDQAFFGDNTIDFLNAPKAGAFGANSGVKQNILDDINASVDSPIYIDGALLLPSELGGQTYANSTHQFMFFSYSGITPICFPTSGSTQVLPVTGEPPPGNYHINL